MKVSVILGVSQMLFGVALSCWNHVYFRKYSNIVFEFIPQIIFLMAIFGYMNGMIFAKWFKYSAIDGPNGSACAPSILITLINMFLYKYPDDPKQPCYLNTWYSGQKYFQTGLLLLALLCVPWMLVLKPWYLNRQNKRDMIYKQRTGIKVIDTMVLISSEGDNSEQAGQGGHGGHGGHEGEFDLGDVIIHQAIHTIEYCLGSISHTASYLRLWALSLAHAQLSEVLWTMVFTIGIKGMGFGVIFNGIIMYVVFVFWSSLTISVLLVMEGLSAFLHALRLHWVEFQSKFYTGSGFAFQPFAFDTILELAEKESAAEPSS